MQGGQRGFWRSRAANPACSRARVGAQVGARGAEVSCALLAHAGPSRMGRLGPGMSGGAGPGIYNNINACARSNFCWLSAGDVCRFALGPMRSVW